jgi:heterodisulfide reductase subunit A-like polyferredoxin
MRQSRQNCKIFGQLLGGGVAGIQAALEIADAGYRVYLVERQGTIGGHMAMFDKTFPTLDCAACILTPKMVAVGQHPNIELLVLSELQDVTGRPGAYHIKVLKKATYVDPKACVACNACAEICPVSVPSEFDVGIADRHAIYIPFPQAVPNTYIIDGASCLYVQSEGKKCGACQKKCAKDAIHFDDKDQLLEFDVGNIVITIGYDTFDARRIDRYSYGVLPNVLTSLEFERLTNASGPTGGKIVMKTKKLNKRIKTEGVHVVRGRSAQVVAQGDRMMVRGEDIIHETIIELPVDMVLLAVGIQPTSDAERFASMLGIERVQDGWFSEMEYNVEPTSTERGGIFVAGVCQGPKDIPDTVAQAAGVAAMVLKSIVSGHIKGSRQRMTLLDIEQKALALSA